MTPAPPLLRAYMTAHGIDPQSVLPDGRVGLSFDGRWRVQLRPLTDGRFLMSALLLDVSNLTRSQLEELLLSLANYAVGVMQDHACGLALDEASGRLMLQEQVPAETSLAQLEALLGDFVNLLAFWNGSARMEVVRREVAPMR